VKIEKTRKGLLAEWRERRSRSTESDIDLMAEILGIEFAPEKPKLPPGFGFSVDPGTSVERLLLAAGPWGGAALEGYNRFCSMKRELEAWEYARTITAGVVLGHCLKIARGEQP
jgi:hypothetical protein